MTTYVTVVTSKHSDSNFTQKEWYVEVFDSEENVLISDAQSSTFRDALLDAFEKVEKDSE
jgi:hypothetical protein